jgi:hypothetical protein
MPGTMELWWITGGGSVQGASWYAGGDWQPYAQPLVTMVKAALQGGIAAVSRIPTSMELSFVGANDQIVDENWYEDLPHGGLPIAAGPRPDPVPGQ